MLIPLINAKPKKSAMVNKQFAYHTKKKLKVESSNREQPPKVSTHNGFNGYILNGFKLDYHLPFVNA